MISYVKLKESVSFKALFFFWKYLICNSIMAATIILCVHLSVVPSLAKDKENKDKDKNRQEVAVSDDELPPLTERQILRLIRLIDQIRAQPPAATPAAPFLRTAPPSAY